MLLFAIRRRAHQSPLESSIYGSEAIKLVAIHLEHSTSYQIVAVWPFIRVNLEHHLQDSPDVIRVVVWDALVLTFTNTLEQLIHLMSTEWNL